MFIRRKMRAGMAYILSNASDCEDVGNLHIFLKILSRKKHCQIKLLRLQKVQIWAFGSFVHEINSFDSFLNWNKSFLKNGIVTGKTPFIVISPFCTHHSLCLNSEFWYGGFVWK